MNRELPLLHELEMRSLFLAKVGGDKASFSLGTNIIRGIEDIPTYQEALKNTSAKNQLFLEDLKQNLRTCDYAGHERIIKNNRKKTSHGKMNKDKGSDTHGRKRKAGKATEILAEKASKDVLENNDVNVSNE